MTYVRCAIVVEPTSAYLAAMRAGRDEVAPRSKRDLIIGPQVATGLEHGAAVFEEIAEMR